MQCYRWRLTSVGIFLLIGLAGPLSTMLSLGCGGKPSVGFRVSGLTFSRDGKELLVAGSEDAELKTGAVHVWETGQWSQVATLRFKGPVLNVVFAPDGKRLFTASPDVD